MSRHESRDIEIRTDSSYAVEGLTNWSQKWVADNWQRTDIKNKDLFRDIIGEAQSQGKNIYLRHVRGHGDDHANNTADAYARQGANW